MANCRYCIIGYTSAKFGDINLIDAPKQKKEKYYNRVIFGPKIFIKTHTFDFLIKIEKKIVESPPLFKFKNNFFSKLDQGLGGVSVMSDGKTIVCADRKGKICFLDFSVL